MVIRWQITDPVKAVYEVNDLVGGIIQLTITAMRNVIGELDPDHALSSRDTINSKLWVMLDNLPFTAQQFQRSATEYPKRRAIQHYKTGD